MSVTDYGGKVAAANRTSDTLEIGPWRGYRASVPADRLPLEYAATGSSNFLYRPRSGTWKRRKGTSAKFSSDTTGLLPGANWGAKCRQLEEFTSDNITDDIPTLIALVTKEVITSGLDNGRFSNVWVRDQVNDINYTMGSEFNTTDTYPDQTSEQSYKYVPLWYDSADGGMSRGISEFQRRLLVCGARRMEKVGRWWYFPSYHGVPSRWLPAATEPTSGNEITATGEVAGEFDGGQYKWQYVSGASGWQSVQSDDGDATFVHVVFAGEVNFPFNSSLTFPALAASANYTVSVTCRLTDTYTPVSPTNNGVTFYMELNNAAGNTYRTNSIYLKNLTASASYSTIDFQINTATDLVGTGTANRLKLVLSTQQGESFTPGFRITKIAVSTLASAASASRLIPTGPLPPLHAGTLAKGDEIENNATYFYPSADIPPTTNWTPSTGSTLWEVLDHSAADDTGDYITCDSTVSARTCEVQISTMAASVPQSDESVVVEYYIRYAGNPSLATAYLVANGVVCATLPTSPLASGDFRQWTWTLTPAQIAAVTTNNPAWDDVSLRFTKAASAGASQVQISSARIGYLGAGTATDGGWRGSDRFYYSVAFRDEYGAVWQPCVPRGPNDQLTSGYNLFTVNSSNPTAGYEYVTWSNIPIGPYGTQSRLLLRTTKIDTTRDSTLQLDPYDLRLVWEIKDNTTTTYQDFFADDDSLKDDPDGLFIHFDHRMPPRARYISGGVSRVATSCGGENPCAIILAPVGASADYDLNVADDADAGYLKAMFYKLTSTTLTLIQTADISSITQTETFTLSNYSTIEKLVDAINATNFATDGQQWRAQIAPGANTNANPATALMPTYRQFTGCAVDDTAKTITKSGIGTSVPVGAFLDPVAGSGVTAGAYIDSITSSGVLHYSGTITTSASVTLGFVTGTGDTPTTTLTQYSGYVRVIAGSLPGFIYFNKTYLDTYPVEKSTAWMTTAIPGSSKSAPNNWVTRDANRFRPPLEAGISMGIAAVDNGFVVPFSKKNAAIRNERDSGTGVDRDYHLFILNESRGCIAFQSVGAGNRFAHLLTPEGLVACDLRDEMLLSRDVYTPQSNDAVTGVGDWSSTIPALVGSTAEDDDDDDFYVRSLRGALWCSYDSDGGGISDRQIVYDFSAAVDQSGLSALKRGGEPWGWSAPLTRAVSCMCEGRRADGGHLYGWSDANAQANDGRIDEFETGDTDNGSAITGNVNTPWIKNPGGMVALQEINAEHVSPTGSTTTLKVHRSYSDDSYTLTPTVSGSLISTDELILLPQGARVPTRAFYLEWGQTAGGASEVEKLVPRFKRLRRLKP